MHPFRFIDALPLRRNLRYREATKLLDDVMDDMIRRRRSQSSPPWISCRC